MTRQEATSVMDVKKLVLLIGALLIAAVTAVMAKNMFTGASAPEASATPVVPAGPEVLVATRSLPVGTIIDAEALRYQPWPQGLVQPAYYIKGNPGTNPSDLLGTVVRNEITAGQPLTQGALIKPGDRGFLAAALGPGMRAVTVAVSSTSSVAGFVFPGDRVDLVLTQEVQGGGDGAPLKVSETIIRNARVLATDQRTSAQNAEGKTEVKSISTVTLEATRRSPRRSPLPRRSASCRCRCARSPTIPRSSSGPLQRAKSKCRKAPIPTPSAACCSRSPRSRPTAIQPTRSAPMSRAFSAAASPPRAATGASMRPSR